MVKLGLIGYPIKHSLSPWIHEQFLQKAEIDGEYKLYEIDIHDDFEEEIAKLKEKGLKGFNVTVPYKEKIMDYLDELDDSVEKIGAVNTVLNDQGKWIGYNTDGLGYVKALMTEFPHLKDKRAKVLILGAGGAARGIYYAFLQENIDGIDIANRTVERAEAIIEMNDGKIKSKALTLVDAEDVLADYDLIVHTSSVGMKPNVDEMIISLDRVKAGAVVSDIVYQPIKTKLLQEAEKRDCSIHFGHTMLLYQAQLAFMIWTKEDVEVGNMAQTLQNKLEG